MRVKFCGMTNLDDAAEAVRLGAWAIGLIHYSGSPRDVDPAVAAEIAAAFRRKCEVVGVFVNPTLEEVARAVEDEQLTMVQLNGEEGASFCAEVGRRTGVKVAKAVHVASAADVHAAEAYRSVDFHLFDRRAKGLWGGSGESFDWELLRGHRSDVPAILAGGLTPDNIAAAIATAHPYAVDVASGVEIEPGRKDHAAMAAFFANAQPQVADSGLPQA
jgi:phosphoribosylanthranilate isomerase